MNAGGVYGADNGYQPSMAAVGGTFSTGADIAPYVAGWADVNRQRYVDEAVNGAQEQAGIQLGAASRQAAQQGRRFIMSPTARIKAAAMAAAAGTQAGFKADDMSFERQVQLAKLMESDRQFKASQADSMNNLRLQYMRAANEFRLAQQNGGGYGGMRFRNGGDGESDYANAYKSALGGIKRASYGSLGGLGNLGDTSVNPNPDFSASRWSPNGFNYYKPGYRKKKIVADNQDASTYNDYPAV